MRVLPETKREFTATVELTGRELQLIQRALLYVDSSNAPKQLKEDEVDLLGEIESVLDDNDIAYLDQ